jgi:hypothetical protein
MQGPDTDAQDHPLHLFTSGLQRTAGPYRWVKTGNTRSEQMTSALPPKADSSRTSGHVRKVPEGDIWVYSTTSSAWASNVVGTTRLSAFAVLTLIDSSTRVGCSTGKSPGCDPSRILLT